ncbi:hypothetical protein Tco_1132941 [Tanacetum coccineum]|uniref:Uncharacterized protein n=1 Tax=Tanacetum coccineum TaxID=301880 RepID=A0ABQ5JDC3_9ASTR
MAKDSLKGIDWSKLVITEEMIDYDLAKYGNKWEVDDAMADEILDDKGKGILIDDKTKVILNYDKGNGILNDDKEKLIEIKFVDDLEKKIQNVEEVLYKAK